jgi:hypothetical protein
MRISGMRLLTIIANVAFTWFSVAHMWLQCHLSKIDSEPLASMQGMNRLFQGAATVDSIFPGNPIVQAADAGLRSLFVGFESVNAQKHLATDNTQYLNRYYEIVV